MVYCITALLFVAFGQYIGRLFKTHPPLRAYSIEVAGSLAGIGLFALLSHCQTSPTVWFALGFVALVALLPPRARDVGVVAVLAAVVLLWTRPAATGHTWSPYYRISVEPLEQITDRVTKGTVAFEPPVGHVLAVNTDFHQMMLDLRPQADEHAFLTEWRAFYDAPYRGAEALPPGPILIVGAGTGNDVAAALRNTQRRITAVEIDPGIAGLGRELHGEQPYQDPRVTLVIDDARSFFHRTRDRYAMVVFGLLDSHRLLSSFSSVRLDNFIYTQESMAEVRRLLVPGGRVALSFVTVRPWVHERLLALMDQAFDHDTTVSVDPKGYANGTLFLNGRAPEAHGWLEQPEPPGQPERGEEPEQGERGPAGQVPGLSERGVGDVEVPSDDWPFLYLRRRSIPTHNKVFLALALLLSVGALLLLPKGERRIRLPYFFLGAAFFLLETSNVVRMSLLYGSTWWVNTVVFAGILALVLLSNLTAHFWQVPLGVCLAALSVGIVLAAADPVRAAARPARRAPRGGGGGPLPGPGLFRRPGLRSAHQPGDAAVRGVWLERPRGGARRRRGVPVPPRGLPLPSRPGAGVLRRGLRARRPGRERGVGLLFAASSRRARQGRPGLRSTLEGTEELRPHLAIPGVQPLPHRATRSACSIARSFRSPTSSFEVVEVDAAVLVALDQLPRPMRTAPPGKPPWLP